MPAASDARPRKTIACLATSAAMLAGLCWQLTASPADTSPIAPQPPAPAEAADDGSRQAAPEFAMPGREPDAAALAETLQRPLMRPGRRPFVAPPAVAPTPETESAPEGPPAMAEVQQPPVEAAPPLPQGLALIGIMGSAAHGRRVLLRTADKPEARWLQQGESLDGWSVAAIGPASVKLDAPGNSKVLELYAATAAASSAAEGGGPGRQPH